MRAGEQAKFVRHHREERALVLGPCPFLDSHVRIEVQSGFDRGQRWWFPREALMAVRP